MGRHADTNREHVDAIRLLFFIGSKSKTNKCLKCEINYGHIAVSQFIQ
jgi:hypothetical protein